MVGLALGWLGLGRLALGWLGWLGRTLRHLGVLLQLALVAGVVRQSGVRSGRVGVSALAVSSLLPQPASPEDSHPAWGRVDSKGDCFQGWWGQLTTAEPAPPLFLIWPHVMGVFILPYTEQWW